MFHSTKALLILSTLLIISCATGSKNLTDADVDISGFEEMTPDEYLELVAGKSVTGIHRGNKYVQSHTHDKRVNGIHGGEPYSGRWTAGENNCTLVIFDTGPGATCWKLLHKDGKYIYGMYNRNGTKLTMSHYATFVD